MSRLSREDEALLAPRMRPIHSVPEPDEPVERDADDELENDPDTELEADFEEQDHDEAFAARARRITPDAGPTLRERIVNYLEEQGGRLERSDGMITHHLAQALQVTNEQCRNALTDLSQRREIWRDTRGGKRTYAIGIGPGPSKVTVTRTNYAPPVSINDTRDNGNALTIRRLDDILPDHDLDLERTSLVLQARYIDLLLEQYARNPAPDLADRIERVLGLGGPR